MSKKIIIDATDLVLGRMGTVIAKTALLGGAVDIVNCEESVILGSKNEILEKYKRNNQRGIPAKGPFFYRKPDMFVKRSIRGMLPYKKERGMKAFKSIKCHIGIPENFKNQKIETVDKANIIKNPSERIVNYTKIKDICMYFGWVPLK